jgi:hypothetical protein
MIEFITTEHGSGLTDSTFHWISEFLGIPFQIQNLAFAHCPCFLLLLTWERLKVALPNYVHGPLYHFLHVGENHSTE